MKLWLLGQLAFIREPSQVQLALPIFFHDEFYWCMSWRGIRYCASTVGRMKALQQRETTE